MITDFVKNNQARLKCLECEAEHQIIQYFVDNSFIPPISMIDYQKTDSELAAFISIHKLCKKKEKQLSISNLYPQEN